MFEYNPCWADDPCEPPCDEKGLFDSDGGAESGISEFIYDDCE
jgi:hypothetical protein